MKLLYFTLEDINSGLFDSQVLNTIVSIKNTMPNIHIKLLVINQPWRYFRAKAKFQQLKKAGVDLIYLPFLPPLRWISSGSFITNIYLSYF